MGIFDKTIILMNTFDRINFKKFNTCELKHDPNRKVKTNLMIFE